MLLLYSLFVPAQNGLSRYAKNVAKDSSFYRYKDELEEAKKTGAVTTIIEKHIQLGDFYDNSEIYTEAVDQFTQALQIARPDDTVTVVILGHLGKVNISLKNYSRAHLYLKRAENLSGRLHYKKGLALTAGLLGSCAEKQGNYEEALSYQQQSLELFTELEDHEGIARVNESIGSIYEDLEQFDKAHLYFLKAYELVKNEDTFLHNNILNNLGDVFRKTGDYEKGLSYTLLALELAERLKDGHQLESAHKDLSKTYVLLNDYKKAFGHLKKAEDMREQLFYSQNFNQMNVLQTIYETKQKEAQIRLLTQQNEVNAANQQLLWAGMIFLVCLAITIFFFLNKKRKATAKLQEYKQRIMKAELAQKTIEERNLQDEIQVKTASLSKYSLTMAQKNKLIADVASSLKNMSQRTKVDVPAKLNNLAKELEASLEQDAEWDEFMQFFEDIHPDFIKNISSASTDKLTSTELRLAMLLRLNLSSKEIASVLRVTPDSVRVARYRLRKKLPIDQKQELVNFMLDF